MSETKTIDQLWTEHRDRPGALPEGASWRPLEELPLSEIARAHIAQRLDLAIVDVEVCPMQEHAACVLAVPRLKRSAIMHFGVLYGICKGEDAAWRAVWGDDAPVEPCTAELDPEEVAAVVRRSERREQYRQRCGFQVQLPDGNVMNVTLAEAEAGALRELVDAGAIFPRPMRWSHERPFEDFADMVCTDDQPFTRERYEAMCKQSRAMQAVSEARGPVTPENAVARAWEDFDALGAA